MANSPNIKGRAHSKFSASGAERYFQCPGSVELSEGMPDKSSPWAEEGTRAHKILEDILLNKKADTKERGMYAYALQAAEFIWKIQKNHPESELLAESRVYLSFIHPEMFGTLDASVVEYFGTLHVIDFKFGAGHFVSPVENLQLIFYAIGVANKYDWNFKRVRLWIIQPRVKGYDGPLFWDISIADLRKYVKTFKEAVGRVEAYPDNFVEGQWCHWCKAKSKCPLKIDKRNNEAMEIFKYTPIKGANHGEEKGYEKENKKGRKSEFAEESEEGFY